MGSAPSQPTELAIGKFWQFHPWGVGPDSCVTMGAVFILHEQAGALHATDSGSGSSLHQYPAHLEHGRSRKGQIRPPGPPHGSGRHGLRAVDAIHALQPGQSRLAGARSLRTLRGPRIDAPLLAASSYRFRFADGGDPAVPAVGEPY